MLEVIRLTRLKTYVEISDTCKCTTINFWIHPTFKHDIVTSPFLPNYLLQHLIVSVQVAKILEKHEPGRSGISALNFLTGHVGGGGSCSAGLRLGPIPSDEASAVQNYVEHMLFLLMEEEAGQGDQITKEGINM